MRGEPREFLVERARWYIPVLGTLLWVLALGVALILGLAAAPDGVTKWKRSAYDCPGGSHEWDATRCAGMQLGKEGQVWSLTLPSMSLLNQMFYLNLQPYTAASVEKDKFLEVLIKYRMTVYGADSDVGADGGVWTRDAHVVEDVGVADLGMLCFEDSGSGTGARACEEEKALDLAYLDYQFYHIELQVVHSDGYGYLGDMELEMVYITTAYSVYEILMRAFFLCLNALLLLAVGAEEIMAFRAGSPVSLERVTLLLAALSLIGYNNPIFLLEMLVRGSLWNVLAAVVRVPFMTIMVAFFLLHARKMRMRTFSSRNHSVAPLVLVIMSVFVYALSTYIFQIASRIYTAEDPLFEPLSAGVWLLIAMLYIMLFVLAAVIVVWACLAALAMIEVFSRRHLLRSLLIVHSMAAVAVLSEFVALILGALRTEMVSPAEFTYFSTLYNVMVWMLLFLFWPLSDTPLFSTTAAKKPETDERTQSEAEHVRSDDSKPRSAYGAVDESAENLHDAL